MSDENWKDIKDAVFEIGDTFTAKIRHCNKKLEQPDQIVKLYHGEDNDYFQDENGERSCDELSWNWDVIAYKDHKKAR